MTVSAVGAASPVSRSQPAKILPDLQTLAPIKPIPVPRQPTNESITTCSSVTSHDTFMTALTSTHSPTSTSPSKLNVPSSHSLRKSISVDSFITNKRCADLSESGPSSSVNTHDYTRDSFESDVALDLKCQQRNSGSSYTGGSDNSLRSDPSKSLASRILGRARGHSISGPSASNYDDPYLDDSEHERTTDMAHLPSFPSHRTHSTSSSLLNGLSKGKAKARQGDVLLLPPRVPTLSNASSASSISSSANSHVFSKSVPPIPPLPHLHHRRPNVPGPLVMPRRTRSGSLGTRPTRNFWASHDAAFSIAVVGSPGCGKTTAIKKGLKTWGVSDESICSIATPQGRLRYGSRTINAYRDDEGPKIAHVIELDSNLLSLDSPNGAWPEGLPSIDGILVCYDASDAGSFARVPELLASYHALQLSAVAMACKCDLEKRVLPHRASERAAPYNVGLVEVTSITDIGKRKIRHSFHWLIRAIEKAKRGDIPIGSPYRNPASPDVLNAPWSDGYGYPESRNGSIASRVSTPSASSPSTATKFREHPLATTVHVPGSPPAGASTPTPTPTPTPRTPSVPTSPTRVKSTNDLLSEVERRRQAERRRESLDGPLGRQASMSVGSLHETLVNDDKESESKEKNDSTDLKDERFGKGSDPPPMPWATLEELLDKLFFLAVSGDDPIFIKHFFLTYRKFATPRSVLLGMQKRVRQLNQERSDLLLGSYAQMRICDLLEEWIEAYPNDFALPGTAGAITAFVKQISSNPCTLHYGSDILPFLDDLPNLQDLDASWSIQVEDAREESDDDGLGLLEDEDEERRSTTVGGMPVAATVTASAEDSDFVETKPKLPSITTRERKGSLPLSTRSIMSTPLSTTLSGSSDNSSVRLKPSGYTPKNSPRELVKLAQALATYDPVDIAEQITKQQSELFLAIEPRQWLRYTMGDARLEPAGEPISASASFYNHLANWVSSLILAHDKVRVRERQVERFVELATKLRLQNNYVGLRAVMTGINNATFPNDEIITMFRDHNLKEYRSFLGWQKLLNSTQNHRAYRLALKNTNGPGIPDMEVHTFDMVRANESNPNHKLDDQSRIHWGKFTLMARMITMLQGLQEKIRSSGLYGFPERKWIRDLLNHDVMQEDTIQSRVFPPPDDAEPIFPVAQGLDSPNATRSDAARFKRLFFW